MSSRPKSLLKNRTKIKLRIKNKRQLHSLKTPHKKSQSNKVLRVAKKNKRWLL
jgi:hypothetical protein